MRVWNDAITKGAVHRPSGVRAGGPKSGGWRVSGSADRSGLSAYGSGSSLRREGSSWAASCRAGNKPAKRAFPRDGLERGANRVDGAAADPAAESSYQADITEGPRPVG